MKTKRFKFKCPAKFKGRGRQKLCWRIEKLSRDERGFVRKGYATAFHDPKGKLVGYGKGYITPGRTVQAVCGATRNVGEAAITMHATAAQLDGELCVQFVQRGKRRKRG